MPKISQNKINKIKEEIIYILFESTLTPLYTSIIADKLIRDEEFTLKLLTELHKDGLVEIVQKNKKGNNFLRRKRWMLKPEVYSTYRSLSKQSIA